ncbi:hypothetical protein COS75_03330 [Candidatus Pacearchaeota archaeon CG06_land_8_20_14_3_00_35_12]|nr:MAG: hypothetical protein COS75_03330 [Candidatus Pacearchaeota archaeon CG06_land_8_20_14_3_00_35_12]
MKSKTTLFFLGLLTVILGVLPLIKTYLPILTQIPQTGIIYPVAIIIIGLIGIVSSFSSRTY